MNRKLGIALAVPATALLIAGVAGCNITTPSAVQVCSGGKCGTISAVTPSAKPTPVPVATTPAPTTPAVIVTPTPSVTATAVSVGPCSVNLTHEQLVQLAYSEADRDALMRCMQVSLPDVALDNWLIEHALDAANEGPQGRQNWESSQLAGAYRQYG